MAGKYVTILNPGYSTLFTRDLPYVASSTDATGTNPLDPTDSRALVEGELLEFGQSSDRPRFTRGGNNAVSDAGNTPDGEGTDPAFLFFAEKGRYDTQSSKLCHCIMGPLGFEFRTKLCYAPTAMTVNDRVSVWDWDGDSSAYGLVRRVLAAFSAGWIVGRVSRIYGTNDIAVVYGLQ